MPRRVNKFREIPGKHWTVQKVTREGEKMFGFAQSDDGELAYMPRSVVSAEDMQSDDEGAGFTAATRPTNTPHAALEDGAYDQIVLPIKWDEDDPVVKSSGTLDEVATVLQQQEEVLRHSSFILMRLHNDITELARDLEIKDDA